MKNQEHLEAEISSLNEKTVQLVIPSYGNVSTSEVGILYVKTIRNSLGFMVNTINGDRSITFTVEDVKKIESPLDKSIEKIIRLKGPTDYRQVFEEIPIA